ncbi:hypothetical protein LTR48_006479 [Friedmanniomyces endolithicus]|nr:hypothetical protein LTR29_016561 [Friedmanniomyces endolithicus]KAK1091350.1 hypothetical protein LTR48_006479 [Friedmanniomyces endolithicus]KAK1808485.1 hypothetical protein LTR12_017163 [Friedmanniomyces endolithicus]
MCANAATNLDITVDLDSSYSSVPCPWTGTAPPSPSQIVSNWYTIWAGDYSVLNQIVLPNVQLYQDRFPQGGNGSAQFPIYNSSQFLEFVKEARADFETYSFIDDFHFGNGNTLALRWVLNATYAGSSTGTAHKGSHIGYNGTDILLLDPCSELIEQVLSAQDLITYYHELGVYVGTV